MGLFDDKFVFSDSQDLSGAGSAYSADEVDFGETYPDKGQGSVLVVRFVVEVAFTTLTSLQIALVHGADTAPKTQIVMTAAIAQASLTKGAYIPELKIPDQHLRYMRLYYIIVGSNPGAGTITAFVDINPGSGAR